MARFDILEPEYARLLESQRDPDDAVEIGSTDIGPRFINATRCEFDNDGDLVYGTEVPLEMIENVPVQLKLSGGKIVHDDAAIVLASPDGGLRHHTVFLCRWPYSADFRSAARLRSISHKPRTAEFAQETMEKLNRHARLIEATDWYDYDPFRKDGKGLKAYCVPDRRGDDFFSGRRADQKIAEMFPHAHASFDEFPHSSELLGRQPYCFGICAKPDEAKTWLRNHSDIREIANYCKSGSLPRWLLHRNKLIACVQREEDGLAVPEKCQREIDRILEVCIHLVLCGTVSPNEYRGISDAKDNQGGAPQKNTVATHLRHVFADTVRLISLRKSQPTVRARPVDWTNLVAAPSGPVSCEDDSRASFTKQVQEVIKAWGNGLAACDVTLFLEEAIRINTARAIVPALAAVVAHHRQGGCRSDKLLDLIRELSRTHEPAVCRAAQWALQELGS